MTNQQTIVCAFCKGKGTNPHYRGTCPVCKGKGKNQIFGAYITCSECKGSGRKSGTTLTCFSCKGVGVIPDTREFVRQAMEEARMIQQEMEEEKKELYGKVTSVIPIKPKQRVGKPVEKKIKKEKRKWEEGEIEDDLKERREDSKTCFCQSCGKEGHKESLYKVCEKCFFLYKFGKVRKKEVKEEENEG